MSAEKNRSKGAPFWICERKFPEDPYVTETAMSGCALPNAPASSSMANFRSAAAATSSRRSEVDAGRCARAAADATRTIRPITKGRILMAARIMVQAAKNRKPVVAPGRTLHGSYPPGPSRQERLTEGCRVPCALSAGTEIMNHPFFGAVLGAVTLALAGCGGEQPAGPTPEEQVDRRASLRTALQSLSDASADALFRLHFRAVSQVVEAGDRGGRQDGENIDALWRAFSDASVAHSPRLRESYLDRSRPLIVSWISPTDGQVSFAWLTLPARWDAEREYPLYVQLHGLWDVAQDRLPYLAYPYSNPGTSFAFEDGYLVSPWGRGNLWYRGIAETDIWECMTAVKDLVRVEDRRQYLCGHSMGGYGAWHIAHSSAEVWAALGIHAGALQYDMGEVNATVATEL